jgi:hypothetical protein
MPNKGTLTLTSGLVAARIPDDGWIDAGAADTLAGVEFALESVRVDIGPNDRQHAPVMMSLSCAPATLMRLALEIRRALCAHDLLDALDVVERAEDYPEGSLERGLLGALQAHKKNADDGRPDIANADAWIADASGRLAALAHEHNDARLMDLCATLADINTRGTVVPREAEG